MIDLIKPNIFPNEEVIAGVATGYVSEILKRSYFETQIYNSQVVENDRKQLEKAFSSYFDFFYYQKQTHSDIILLNPLTNSNDLNILESDSIISQQKGILYNVSIADCQAILVYDPNSEAVVAIHSGWRGTKLNIVDKTINRMMNLFKSNPENLLVYLSPSASVENYEVGQEFMEMFPESTIHFQGKYFFNNRKQIIQQLISTGIKKSNIESTNECTINNSRYHSFRRDGSRSGRMSAFIGLKH